MSKTWERWSLTMEATSFLGIIVITVINILHKTAKYFFPIKTDTVVALAVLFLQIDCKLPVTP